MRIIWDCEKVSRCDAFYYEIDMEGKKHYPNKYIGYKEGTPDGTYKTSIVKLEEQFYEDLLIYDAVMRIKKTGPVPNMKKLEKEKMDMFEVNSEEQFYNASASNGYMVDTDFNNVRDKIQNNEYKVTTEKWETVFEMVNKQLARQSDFTLSHVKNAKDRTNDTNGKWLLEEEQSKPVLVLEDYYGKGKHWRIGKRHTIEGISQTKFKPNLDVMWIPKSDHSKLKIYELRELALEDNPVQKHKRLENEISDVVDMLVDYCLDNNKTQTDPSIQEKLENKGYEATAIRGIKTRIKNKLAKKGKGLASNERFEPTSPERGAKIAEGYRTSTTHSIPISSGYKSKVYEGIVTSLANDEVHKKDTWIISVYHTSVENYLSWPKKKVELENELADLAKWLKVTRGKGVDEEVLQEIKFLIREKDPISIITEKENSTDDDNN